MVPRLSSIGLQARRAAASSASSAAPMSGRPTSAWVASLTRTAVGATALEALDQAARRACKPIDDKRGTIEYRIKIAGVMARRAATLAHERAGERR